MNKLKQMHLALALTILASICFAFPAVFVKLLMNDISPIGALTVRFLIAAIGFPIIVACMKKSKLKAILTAKGYELKDFCILGFLLFASIATLFTSFEYIAANMAMLIFMTYPIFDMILAGIFLREKPSRADLAAVVLTFIGAYFVFGMQLEAKQNLIGYGLALMGTILWAAYVVMSREVGVCYDYYKRTAWLFIFAFFFFMITFFITGTPAVLVTLPQISWLWIFLFATVSTLVPYMSLSYATEYVKSSVISVILLVGNVISIGLVSWLFHEQITANMYIGSALIVAGFVISIVAEWEDEEKKYHHLCHH